MTTAVGRNVRLEIGLTYSAAKVVTAVTKALPGVASSAAHGLANGSVGYWTVSAGMTELDGQASRVYNQAAGTFEIQGVDTTNYGTFTAGTYTPVATLGTLAEAVGYEIGGGAADAQDDTKLLDSKHRNFSGLLAAQNVNITIKNQTVNSAVLDAIESAAKNLTSLVWRITLHDGAVRVFRGVPSLPGESLQSGALASGSFTILVDAWVAKGLA
jgi:hypothetical protein